MSSANNIMRAEWIVCARDVAISFRNLKFFVLTATMSYSDNVFDVVKYPKTPNIKKIKTIKDSSKTVTKMNINYTGVNAVNE